MNPILCMTDFSELTTEAVKVASRFAQSWGEGVVLVRSVDEREQFPFGVRSSLVAEDWRRLAEEAQRLRAQGFAVGERVLRGMPEDGVAQFAWNAGASLIVVGSTPTGVLDRWALGCLAEEIVATSLVPVLAVRSATPFEEWVAGARPLRVFVGVDPAARPDAVLHRLDELREIGACTLIADLLPYPEHTHTGPARPPAEYRDHEFRTETDFAPRLSRELQARHAVVSELKGKAAEAALVEQATAAGADLLVITSRPRADLTLLPHRCLARTVLRRAPMSVLCVPEADIEPPRATAPAHGMSTGPSAGGPPPPDPLPPIPSR